MYTIYALYLNNDQVYVGMTDNLERRLKEHRRGKTKTTKNKYILKIIIIEKHLARKIARIREKYWKSGCGKEQLKLRGGSSVG